MPPPPPTTDIPAPSSISGGSPPPSPTAAPAPPKAISVHEVETLVRRLRGVLACRVVASSSGVIDEVHALAEASRPAKMVVRDIESALRAEWNLRIARNKVSVAQIDPAQPRPEVLRQPAARPRLRLLRAEFVDDPLPAARVALGRPDGTEAVGVAGAVIPHNSEDDRGTLLAKATLRAAENIGDRDDGRLQLISLAPVLLGDQRAVALLVRLRTNKGGDLLTGSALVRNDPDRAVVAATLDAVNRRLSSLEPDAHGNGEAA